jgi:uncharacterized protein (TIGR00730 family)
VTGAGVSGGLMGTVADAARLAGARVLGVVPRGLWSEAAIHPDADELHTTPDLAQRLLQMLALADCCVALPGGVGTLSEIATLLTLWGLDLTTLPLGILDCDGYYEPLRRMLEAAHGEGFLARHAALRVEEEFLLWDTDPQVLVDRLLRRAPLATTRVQRAEKLESQRSGGQTVRHRASASVVPDG